MYDVSDCDVCGLIAPCEGDCPARGHECDVCTRRWVSPTAAARCCDQIYDTTD